MRLQASQFMELPGTDGYSMSGTLIQGYDTSSAFVSAPFFVGRALVYCCTVSNNGPGTASIRLEGSTDSSRIGNDKPDSQLTNWFQIPFTNSSGSPFINQTLTAYNTDNAQAFNEEACGYTWVRLRVSAPTGALHLSCKVQFKGVG